MMTMIQISVSQGCARSNLTYICFKFYSKSPRELLLIPTLQLRNKGSVRMCDYLAQDPRARKWPSWDLNPGLCDSKGHTCVPWVLEPKQPAAKVGRVFWPWSVISGTRGGSLWGYPAGPNRAQGREAEECPKGWTCVNPRLKLKL